jgi:subtilisin family serine protease
MSRRYGLQTNFKPRMDDMAKRTKRATASTAAAAATAASSVEQELLAALERGDESLTTGRYLVTFKEGAVTEGVQALSARGLRAADARDFAGQALTLQGVAGADSVVLPEIGVAVVNAAPAAAAGMSLQAEIASDSAIASIDPEHFVFIYSQMDFLRGFKSATDAIAHGLGGPADLRMPEADTEEQVQVLGATWGLIRCKVPPSSRSGAGIKVAVLDTGMDLGHPDFAGRPVTSQSFVAGQPVQDLHSHGTHCIGTSCGPLSPAGTTPRYGVAHKAQIFAGKVLSNTGSGMQAGILAGMNWAIANRCAVISMSLGGQIPVQPSYTAAGQSALNNGCLIVAASGNSASTTGAPANSPTIMSVASLDQNLSPSSFSNFGKVEIAAPGRDVFSSVPRPTRYGIKSGTSMATPHVAGCAALWAETSPSLRGMNLWNKLLATAQPLPFPASRVGKGLVQAPP